MQQPMNTNPVQVVFVTQPNVFSRQSKYINMRNGLARQLIGLGATQAVIGSLCIIILAVAQGIYTNGYYASLDFVGIGFWTGILFAISGAFGIAGGRKRKRCQVVTFNVLSILSASFAALLLIIAWRGAISYARSAYHCYRISEYHSSSSSCIVSSDAGRAMEALMAILALAGGIIAIWSSVICCRIGVCCCNCGDSFCCPPSPHHSQFVKAGQTYPGQQQIIMTNQESQMFLVNQPPTNTPNWQHPTYLPNHQQQPNINLDPRYQLAQYSPQEPFLPPYCRKYV